MTQSPDAGLKLENDCVSLTPRTFIFNAELQLLGHLIQNYKYEIFSVRIFRKKTLSVYLQYCCFIESNFHKMLLKLVTNWFQQRQKCRELS